MLFIIIVILKNIYLSSSDECYSDSAPDIWKARNGPVLKYSPDLIILKDVAKWYLGVRNKFPPQPVLGNGPAGLVKVEPQPGLEIMAQAERMLENKNCQICSKQFPVGMEIVKPACSHIKRGLLPLVCRFVFLETWSIISCDLILNF